MAAFWEAAIKIGLGKLDLGTTWRLALRDRIEADGIGLLGITPPHCAVVAMLAHHHRDLFDRILIAQAQIRSLTHVSRDAVFDRYRVARIW